MLRQTSLSLLTSMCLLVACDEAAQPPPKLELYIDGTLAGLSPTIEFPDTEPGSDGVAVQVELKNLGPSPLELTGSPPLLVERDDRLAFRVNQPATTRFARGESLTFNIVFAPHSPGSSVARVAIKTAAMDEAIVLSLTGEGVTATALSSLVAMIDGKPVGSTYDFGAVRTLVSKEANLRLANGGEGTLDLGGTPVSLSGPDTDVFDLGTATVTGLGAGEHVDIPLTFTPTGCRSYLATLSIAPPSLGEPVEVVLTGRGGENPQGHADATDPELLNAPDLDVTLSGAGVGGKRRFAVGNLTVGGFSGQVGLFAWDGCTLSAKRSISAASSGLTAQLFGAQVALTDDGTTLLISARDQTKDAWLYTIGSDDEPRYLGTLATFDEASGHGRGATISGDGSAVFVGQAMADSGFNAHGAVLAYERPAAGWASAPEARFRLLPSALTQVELVGSAVEVSRNGDVVISGALLTPVGAGSKGPATVFVWSAVRDTTTNERSWGKPISGDEPYKRTETVRLTSAQVPSDSLARVAISADGNTVALSAVVNSEVQIRIYARNGATELWGRNTTSLDERLPTATLKMSASPALRMALGPNGDLLLVADQSGAKTIARPAGGWVDEAPVTTFAQTWNVAFYGALAMAPEGNAFAGMDKLGSAWFVFR